MAEDKEYAGVMRLGVITASQDADGEVLETRPVPDLSPAQIEAAFARYDGDFYQMPPMVSAIKKDGVALYKLARQGKTVEREPRFVHVFAHEVQGVRLPEIDFRVVCSKGFYVRTYAHDIGADLGCGAHLQSLRRTKSGRFNLDRSITVDEIATGPAEAVRAKILTLPEVSRLRGA
jgi:tRNA pseudouridine55 synthase